MDSQTAAKKYEQILAHEEALAKRLALVVLDKPTPPIWMVLIPIFFVFYAWKLKQYANGLKDFSRHYLISRRRALEAAAIAEESGKQVDITPLLAAVDNNIPEETKPLYQEWMQLLSEHYLALLSAKGTDHATLVRNGYRDKTSYLLCSTQLTRAELAFGKALVPQMQGDTTDFLDVLARMDKALADLHRQESEQIFS
ncbi:MAG: hypothetical protein HQQ73_01930 [Desulfobulbaceae bacterium]|nr:hypothetical protein [Desulfobulbaceae bacterium]